MFTRNRRNPLLYRNVRLKERVKLSRPPRKMGETTENSKKGEVPLKLGRLFTDQNVIPANKLIKTVLRFRLSTLASGLTSKILHFFRPLPETIDIKIPHCHQSCTYNSFLEITITIISSIFHNFFTQFSILVSCILLQLL